MARDLFREAMDARLDRAEGRENLIRIFLQVRRAASDIRRVLEGAAPDGQGLHRCLQTVRGQLVELLRVEGVELFGGQGDLVDLAKHEVRAFRPGVDGPSRVLELEEEGASWDGEVIHKAVVVASESRRRDPTES